ncbi:MAG: SPFH domain-containing protein [Planctomycetota bacterium]
MDFWKKLRNELVDIIEWADDRPDVLVWKFPRYNNEIKHGAQLIVRPGQSAVFVDQGKIADVFGPGRYELNTKNLPILSTLLGWKYGFESPFKADVYYVATRRFTALKWGTMNPVMMRDAEFGPVRLRAFGTYALQANDPGALVSQIAGAGASFTIDGIIDQVRNVIVARFADVLGESRIPVLDLAASYDELGTFLRERIAPKIAEYGLDLTTLLVENVSLPPAVEEALDKRSSMGIIGDLQRYTQFQTAEAIGDAAKNPGGGMGDAMGLGAGFAMAGQMAQSMAPAALGQQAPPPVPGGVVFHLVLNGQQAGPFALQQLQQHVAAGTLKPDTLVWKPGMAVWTKALEVPEVAQLVAQTPPPIPPAVPPTVPPPASN